MSQTNINIRIDKELKKEFEKFCSDIGMSMTTAFCIFAKTAIREQKIPFEISTKKYNINDDPFYNPENIALLKKSIDELEMGKGTVHEVLHEALNA